MYGPYFVLAIIAIVMFAKVMNTHIRAKHGVLDDDDRRHRRRPLPAQATDARELESENRALTGQVKRLEERLAVLERIATDPGRRLSDEIDRLRDEEG